MQKFVLTREQLFKDLYIAYYDARKHKRNKPYQLKFEKNLDVNIRELCDELYERRYTPLPSACFIIEDPKKREIFAADFRDRIVHHLYYNYVHVMFERTFIQDSYSCIKRRGTHYGISRLEQHIRKESQNYMLPCYVLKIDIRGYFMHIDRNKLYRITVDSLTKMGKHRISKHGAWKWENIVDVDFSVYLTSILILANPVSGCRIVGKVADWDGLPHDKSLFYSNEGCGLPIGNLTSQLFSNVYMNVFDQYVKRNLCCRHYGRYVDDAFFVSCDKKQLRSYVPKIRNFLSSELGLSLHKGKLQMFDVRKGVVFLGVFIKPYRSYICSSTLSRIKRKSQYITLNDNPKRLMSIVNSYLGMLGHYKTKRL